MKIRLMTVRDISDVASIEEKCFTNPWSEEILYRDYARNPSAKFLVAEVDGTIIGHIGCWRRNDDVHVTTLAVDPEHRRNGIGGALLNRVLEQYPETDLTLEVRKSNEVAQQFYRSAGFIVTGSRPDYYTDNGEDALVMSLEADHRERVADGRS